MIGFKAFGLATGGAVVGAAAALVALALPSGGSGPLGQVAPRTALAASISCNTTLTMVKGSSLKVAVPAVGRSVECMLGRGNQSKAVSALQFALDACYGQHLQTDGIYGPKTQAAVLNAQRAFNKSSPSKISVDGVYGPQTRATINWPFVNDLHPQQVSCQRLGSAQPQPLPRTRGN